MLIINRVTVGTEAIQECRMLLLFIIVCYVSLFKAIVIFYRVYDVLLFSGLTLPHCHTHRDTLQ